MIYKRCSRCGKRLKIGEKCECLKERHKEYDKYSRDKEAADFYHGSQWKKVRERVLELDDNVDVYLLAAEGRVEMATAVHHIIPRREDRSKQYDLDNLISLSESSHAKIEQVYKTDRKGELQEELKRMVKLTRQ